jgi:hypothetical protein
MPKTSRYEFFDFFLNFYIRVIFVDVHFEYNTSHKYTKVCGINKEGENETFYTNQRVGIYVGEEGEGKRKGGRRERGKEEGKGERKKGKGERGKEEGEGEKGRKKKEERGRRGRKKGERKGTEEGGRKGKEERGRGDEEGKKGYKKKIN